MKKLEAPLYLVLLLGLTLALVAEGRQNTRLKARAPLGPKELYALLANPQVKVQIVDTRPADDDHFNDAHIPGAIPFPGCDDGQVPTAAKERIYPYVQTVIVSDEGDPALFEKCRARFGLAQNLTGGMAAWSAANLPEDTGEYSAPKNAAGGGCL